MEICIDFLHHPPSLSGCALKRIFMTTWNNLEEGSSSLSLFLSAMTAVTLDYTSSAFSMQSLS